MWVKKVLLSHTRACFLRLDWKCVLGDVRCCASSRLGKRGNGGRAAHANLKFHCTPHGHVAKVDTLLCRAPQERGMAQDLSWDNAARAYEEVMVAAKYQW